MSKKIKVLLALSGGVDSSVAVKLLLDQGYDVTAAFIRIWSDTKTVQGVCSWKEERRDALRVAALFNVPLITLNFEKEYREQVASYMFREYEAGRTPNPDILCNNQIKFPLLWKEAVARGFDFIATGHYVRKKRVGRGLAPRHESWKLLVGKDPNKDQSYFLHRLTQEDLVHTLFPIGKFKKDKVRKLARKCGIPVADKRSTRGLCFIGKVDMSEFLAQDTKSKPGKIVMIDGKVIGEHKGITPYTIGQRHGFGQGSGKPLFVIKKDAVTNTLVVGEENEPALNPKEIKLTDLFWISGKELKLPLKCKARIRYRAPLESATIYKLQATSYNLVFKKSIHAPAPGQFVVFYKGDECLGGGVIG